MTPLEPSIRADHERSLAIYIVDDDSEVRRSLAFMLAASGHAALSFASGEEFLAALPGLVPGCILVDLRMPGLDGLGVLAALERCGIDWPALIMTGHGEMDIAVQALRHGAFDYLEKPFEEELLMTCLARAAALLRERRSGSSG